ncbi:MAG: hypothetical protein HUU50_13370 [Candidatus Brocadiae bacterium]|nr:hypothetical protein [Candidatus Brocadiia bacterium]
MPEQHSHSPRFLNQPYEQTLYGPPKILDFPLQGFPQEGETLIPDTEEVSEQDSLYLIRERIENLREQIGLTFDEVLELQNLENIIRIEGDAEAPANLGIASKTDQLISALEEKRDDRYGNEIYTGGEDEEESVSSVNQYYQNLLKASRLNLKSIALLTAEKRPVPYYANRKYRAMSAFDLYQTAPKKYLFHQYLGFLWQVSEDEAKKQFEALSSSKQWKLKEQWEQYLEERKDKTPSPYQQVLMHCHDLVTSPIYEGMETLSEEKYRMKGGYDLKFTDKTAIFLIPLSEFEDIPAKRTAGQAQYLQVAFTLPEYAHEKKRFFRKGGSIKEFSTFLERLGVSLSEKQTGFLMELGNENALRLYREVLELPDRDEIRAYFLSIRSGYGNYGKGAIVNLIRDRLNNNENATIRFVSEFTHWFPEWMRKIGGIVVEEKEGKSITIPKTFRVSVDTKLPATFQQERMFMPSEALSKNFSEINAWQNAFIEELRLRWRKNPVLFQKYNEAIQAGKLQFFCSCSGNGVKLHGKSCPVPVLERVFEKMQIKQGCHVQKSS